jgi:hypothetical protein
MGSIGDDMLAAGCVENILAVHGEPFTVLGNGPDAGLTFIGVVEFETDMVMDTELGADPRGKRVVRFKLGAHPILASQDLLRDAANKKWRAVQRPNNFHLTMDYEVIEFALGKDT